MDQTYASPAYIDIESLISLSSNAGSLSVGDIKFKEMIDPGSSKMHADSPSNGSGNSHHVSLDPADFNFISDHHAPSLDNNTDAFNSNIPASGAGIDAISWQTFADRLNGNDEYQFHLSFDQQQVSTLPPGLDKIATTTSASAEVFNLPPGLAEISSPLHTRSEEDAADRAVDDTALCPPSPAPVEPALTLDRIVASIDESIKPLNLAGTTKSKKRGSKSASTASTNTPIMSERSETRPAQKAASSVSATGKADKTTQMFEKTELCRFFSMGCCKQASQCRFAHGTVEVRSRPDLNKTSMCYQYARRRCPLSAAQCRYAHGQAELRML